MCVCVCKTPASCGSNNYNNSSYSNNKRPSTSTFLHEIKSHGSDAYKVGKDKERDETRRGETRRGEQLFEQGGQVVGSLNNNRKKIRYQVAQAQKAAKERERDGNRVRARGAAATMHVGLFLQERH